MVRVHPFENLVVSRLLDFFAGASPWQRALWTSGIVLTLHEVLEASEAARSGVLSIDTFRDLASMASRIAGPDPGIGTDANRRALQQALRSDVVFGGVDYHTIGHIAADLKVNYLKNWQAVLRDGSQTAPPGGERTARALAAHLLDLGFSDIYLHRWCTYHMRNVAGVGTLAELVAEADRLAAKGDQPYKILMGFEAAPESKSGMPQNWLKASEFGDWLRGHDIDPKGIRQAGAFLFTVKARDPWSAVQNVVEQVEHLISRVALGTEAQLRPLDHVWLQLANGAAAGANAPRRYPIINRRRRVEIHALHREDKLYLTERATIVDAGLDLLGALNSGPPSSAVAAGWAAIEALLTGPGEADVLGAERLAALVACSFPRAELTNLSYKIEKQGHAIAPQLASCPTNLDRAALVATTIASGTAFQFDEPSDNAALLRMLQVISNPSIVLQDVQTHVTASCRRLYRNRNLVLHGGKTDAVGLRAVLRTVAPLVGAGMDRVAHGWFVENIRPIEMAARARIRLQTVGDPGVSAVDLLA
jgi:hypothetical protein